MVTDLVFGILGFLLVFMARAGATHFIANIFVSEDKSWRIAARIYIVEILLNLILGFTVWATVYLMGVFGQKIAMVTGGLVGLVLGLYIFWRMLKYVIRLYETHLLEGGIIYVTSLILGGILITGINYFLGLV
ncbi:MAG: hypothetical protein ABEJ99_04020 [Candidatus Nanohaloarchaea archaeon]